MLAADPALQDMVEDRLPTISDSLEIGMLVATLHSATSVTSQDAEMITDRVAHHLQGVSDNVMHTGDPETEVQIGTMEEGASDRDHHRMAEALNTVAQAPDDDNSTKMQVYPSQGVAQETYPMFKSSC